MVNSDKLICGGSVERPHINGSLTVSRLEQREVLEMANVHAKAFPRQRKSLEWIQAKLRGYPATYSYSCKLDEKVVAGILWTHKSGFRERAVLELEQIFVLPELQHRGIGSQLILASLSDVNAQIEAQGFSIGTLCVNTRTDNDALRLYKDTLGVEIVSEVAGHTPGATEAFLARTDVSIRTILTEATQRLSSKIGSTGVSSLSVP